MAAPWSALPFQPALAGSPGLGDPDQLDQHSSAWICFRPVLDRMRSLPSIMCSPATHAVCADAQQRVPASSGRVWGGGAGCRRHLPADMPCSVGAPFCVCNKAGRLAPAPRHARLRRHASSPFHLFIVSGTPPRNLGSASRLVLAMGRGGDYCAVSDDVGSTHCWRASDSG